MNKIIKLITFLIILLLLSGCYNYKEINEYAIVSGISIDKNGDKYKVGIQIMNAKKEEESQNSLITFYDANGNTIYEALEKIMMDSPKELYLGHNEVIVIDENLLKEKDPLDYLDFFMRNSKIEKDSLIMIAKDEKAYNILKIITPLETIPSRNLKATLSVADNYSGALTVVTIDEFISALRNDGADAILPAVTITGKTKEGKNMENIQESDPETKLEFVTLGYFVDNKLKGYLSTDDAAGYNFLANTPRKTYINVLCDDNDNYATVRISNSSTKQSIYFKNNKPYVSESITVAADLLEYNCKADFIKSEKYISDLEKKVSNKVKKLVTSATNKLYKEEKSDVLEYGSLFYKKKYNDMKKLSYTKKNIINDLSFKFNVDVSISSTELSIKSVKGE